MADTGATGAITLAELQRETASRLGPFDDLVASGGASNSVTVAELRTNADLGGLEGLYLLRREAARPTDRVRTVERVDGASGALVVDFPYEDTPVAGERVELHHLHPDRQLLADVHAGLRRCYLLDVLTVAPPPVWVADTLALGGSAAEELGEAPSDPGAQPVAQVERATIRELGANGDANGDGGWLIAPPPVGTPNGDGNGAVERARRVRANWAGLTDRSLRSGGPTAVVDLTAQAPWLTAPRQVLAVAVDGVALPPCGRYGGPSGGWTCYATRGHLYLSVPGGVPLDGLTVRAYRDACGLVNGADAPEGPLADDDLLSVPLDYAAALAHMEAWRRHRDRLEAAAAEGRFASQEEAAAEVTRVASMHADFLFRPSTERPDRPASPWGASSSVNGLGGTGALQGAVVNQNDPYA
jgi:hypothetical protein